MKGIYNIRTLFEKYYSEYGNYIDAAAKFVTALILFMQINGRIGGKSIFGNIFVELILALICAILPPNVMIVLAFVAALLQFASVSIASLAVGGGVLLAVLLLYFAFASRQAWAMLLTILGLFFHVPCIVPISFGLMGSTMSAAAMTAGTVFYYTLSTIGKLGSASVDLAMAKQSTAEKILAELQTMIDTFLGEQEMILMLVVLLAVFAVVFLARRMAMKHAWKVAIAAGTVIYLVLMMAGYMMLHLEIGILWILIGTLISAAEDIKTAKGEVLLEKGTLLETQKSDKEGNLLFVSDLPLGKYEVREIAAPDGYIRTAQTEEIDASWKEEGMAVQKFQAIFENQITKVFVKKTASDTKELLEGAKLAIYQENTCIESWITEKEEHCVEGLEIGKTYTLRELSPAPGYATAAEQVFQMEDHKEEDGTYQGQKLEMQDPPTEVHITVFEKDGDKKVPLGNVKAHLETPQGETLLKENSPMERDGIWESGTEQAEIFKKVAIGHYKIVVDEIPKGYVHPDVTDIEVKDTAEVQKFEVLVEPICIRITGYALSSAAEKKQTRTIRSGIYVHIRDLFEERSLELPEAYTRVPSGSYQVKTDRVPDGYVLPAQTKITVREDTSEIQDFEVEIRPTVIKIEAVDKKTQTPLEGVKISVVNEKGKKIWKHVTLTALKEKVIPSWYTIQVEKVPKGYQKPKNQKIKVKAVANVQKYKVELTKEAQVQTEKRVDTENFDKTTGNDHSGFSSDNTPDNENAVTAAKTGDASWMEMWIFAGLMAASSMILWFFRKKRHIR